MKAKFQWNIFQSSVMPLSPLLCVYFGVIEWLFLFADDEVVGCKSIRNTQLSLELHPFIYVKTNIFNKNWEYVSPSQC